MTEVKTEVTHTEEVEQIVVLPDLYAPTNDMIPVETTFSAAMKNRGFGWEDLNLQSLMRIVKRDAAEVVPAAGGEKIRQMIANTMVFELPTDVLTQISYEKNVLKEPTSLENLVALIKEHASLLCAVRLKGSGETRLHNKLSCAFGGHSDVIDYATAKVILDRAENQDEEREIISSFLDIVVRAGCVRELLEELRVGVDTEANKQLFENLVKTSIIPFGIINSSETPVESVHMGMTNVLAVPDRFELEVNETDKLEMRRFKFKDLVKAETFEDYTLETWTKISFKEELMDQYALAILRSI
jgi:predicted NUDIX family phosphoesterase